MTHLKKGIALIVLLGSLLAYSQNTNDNEKTKISIEVDPATFALKGYSAHLRIQPKGCEHLLFGVGTYALDLPDLLVDFNKENRDKDWDVRINQGYSLFAEHHFTEVNRKWFIGTQVGVQEFKIENTNVLGREKFANLLTMGYLGYTLKPFKNTFYIKPWAGIGYTTKVSGQNRIGSLEYDIAPITMFLTVHFGYTF